MTGHSAHSEFSDQGKRIVCECEKASPWDKNEWNAAAWHQRHLSAERAAVVLLPQRGR